MVSFFSLLFYLGMETSFQTLYAEIIIIIMGFTITFDYFFLLASSNKEPIAPLFLFFILNILNSALVWSTGILSSPFIIFYVILIIIIVQLYNYKYGLLQTLLAITGFVFVYGATTNGLILFSPLLLYTYYDILYQPALVIGIYGMLYAILFLFTVFSSSSARTLLFRPSGKLEINSTYQEKIIQQMPVGVLVVDKDLHILSANPAAMNNFPTDKSSLVKDYFSLTESKTKSLLKGLSRSGRKKRLTWKSDTGDKIPLTIGVYKMKSQKRDDTSYIIFLMK